MIHDIPGAPPPIGLAVTAATIEHLRRTKPWVRFLSVMCFIGSALLVVFGLLLAVMGSALPAMFGGSSNPIGGLSLGIVYLLLALLYIFPGLYLWRYANAIDSLVRYPQSLTLEEAMKHQTAFWRFVGILSAVMLVIYAVALVLVVVFGALGAAAMHH
ncbi:MAG TPA: DUF5362 family protein [Thermoanaerobaculia bacterium]|nr:DUF5362 family protein [Thermoanaerobaculia bacterium]